MTYLDKLLELNRSALKKANLLFAAKHRLENEEVQALQNSSGIIKLKREIGKLLMDYHEALNASHNLLSFVNLNHIHLKAQFSALW
jgi:hypothetical protein